MNTEANKTKYTQLHQILSIKQ